MHDIATIHHILIARQTIVAEDANVGASQAASQHQRRVVQLVAQDQTALLSKDRYVARVGGKPHPKHNRVLLANVLGNKRLKLTVDLGRA